MLVSLRHLLSPRPEATFVLGGLVLVKPIRHLVGLLILGYFEYAANRCHPSQCFEEYSSECALDLDLPCWLSGSSAAAEIVLSYAAERKDRSCLLGKWVVASLADRDSNGLYLQT